MSDLTEAGLARLEALDEQANAAPWGATSAHVMQINSTWPYVIAHAGDEYDFSTDMELIAEARNALPALIAAARELLSQREALAGDEARAVLSDRMRESGSTLAELERLRAIEARALYAREDARGDGPFGSSRLARAAVAGCLTYVLGETDDA